MWRLILIVFVGLAGFWFGKTPKQEKTHLAKIYPEKEFPVVEYKSFVVMVYAQNHALWCKKALRSIFEQEYDHYRVVFIDDGSIDDTFKVAQDFIDQNSQNEKVQWIQKQKQTGKCACLYQAIDLCLEKEIVVLLDGSNWLVSPLALKKLNQAYQNPDVWHAMSSVLHYPSYEIEKGMHPSFYAGLFKQIRLQDLFQKRHFSWHEKSFLEPIKDLAGGRMKKIEEPTLFFNDATPQKILIEQIRPKKYSHLKEFPKPVKLQKAEVLLFSSDCPMQLYACLESIQRYFKGVENLTILYRASTSAFKDAYEVIQRSFPRARFVEQSKMGQISFDPSSEYVLFGIDDFVVKDFVDLNECMRRMEKTQIYGFYLGETPPSSSAAIEEGIYVGNVQENSLERALFKKERIQKALGELKHQDPSFLKKSWNRKEEENGLYFESSKFVDIPANLQQDVLLTKFDQGLKIDLERLDRIESSHLDSILEFTSR